MFFVEQHFAQWKRFRSRRWWDPALWKKLVFLLEFRGHRKLAALIVEFQFACDIQLRRRRHEVVALLWIFNQGVDSHPPELACAAADLSRCTVVRVDDIFIWRL